MSRIKNTNTTLLLVGLTTLITLASNASWALKSDQEQPIYISSDRAERNEKLGTTTYIGAVVMDQGTLHITADKVVVHTKDDEVSRVVATGKPAHYQQQPSPEKELVTAKGLTIDYNTTNELLFLIDEASLKQADGTTITGKRINYDMQKEVAKAESDNTNNERVRVVIPPKRKN